MIDYEVTYILRPSLEEAEVEERSNAISEIIKGQAGEVSEHREARQEAPGVRDRRRARRQLRGDALQQQRGGF